MRPFPLFAAGAILAAALVRRKRLAKLQIAVGLVVAAALAAYGAGAFDLPNLKATIADAGEALGPYTYLLVGALAFLETGAFVGLIAPGETAIIVGGVIAGQGEIKIGRLVALVWVCAVAGDTASFFLGRRLGRDFMLEHGSKVQITPDRLATVEDFFARHGGKTILIGRFVGLVRAVAPFVAGASKMPYRRFLPYDVIGAGLWSTTFCLLGYIFWQSFDQVADYAAKGAFALGTVITVVVAIIYARRELRDQERRTQIHGWLSEQAERPLLKPLVRIVRPLIFRVAIPAGQRAQRPARFTYQRLTPGQLGLELTTLVGVVAVGAYALIALWIQVHGGNLVIGDDRVLGWGDDVRTGTLDDVARAISHLGDGVVIYVVALGSALVVAWRRRVVEAIALVLAMIATTVGVGLIKGLEDRERPLEGLIDTVNASFPSGHAANGAVYFVVAIVLGRAIPSLPGRFAVAAVALVLTLAIGASRVYLRVHYASDVVAGWALAAVTFGLVGIAGLVVTHVRNNSRQARA